MHLTTLATDLLRFIYPLVCPGCARHPQSQDALFCLACREELPFSHTSLIPKQNRLVSLFEGEYNIEIGIALLAMDINSIVEHCIKELKYNHRPEVGVGLGELFAEYYQGLLIAEEIDVLIPVPLHRTKLIARGYNQAEEICKGISAQTEIAINSTSLRRSKKTKTQTQKSKTKRLKSLNKAFHLVSTHDLHGKHVLLVDDVITTGATLLGCIQALSHVENIKISVACIALPVE